MAIYPSPQWITVDTTASTFNITDWKSWDQTKYSKYDYVKYGHDYVRYNPDGSLSWDQPSENSYLETDEQWLNRRIEEYLCPV